LNLPKISVRSSFLRFLQSEKRFLQSAEPLLSTGPVAAATSATC